MCLFASILFIISVMLTLPGLGLFTDKCINSFSDEIDKWIPQNKIVLKGPESLINATLKNSLENDAKLSAPSFGSNDPVLKSLNNQYITYADLYFTKYQNEFESKKVNSDGVTIVTVDVNTFAHTLISFDLGFAYHFTDNSLVRTGIGWIFKYGGLKTIFNTDLYNSSDYKMLILQSQVLSKKVYDSAITADFSLDTLLKGGTKILKTNFSIINHGATKEYLSGHLVNNKIWLFNSQLNMLANIYHISPSLFINTEYISKLYQMVKTNSLNNQNKLNDNFSSSISDYQFIKPRNLYQPNYLSAFIWLQIGAVLLFIIFPIFLLITMTFIYYLFYYNSFKIKKINIKWFIFKIKLLIVKFKKRLLFLKK